MIARGEKYGIEERNCREVRMHRGSGGRRWGRGGYLGGEAAGK